MLNWLRVGKRSSKAKRSSLEAAHPETICTLQQENEQLKYSLTEAKKRLDNQNAEFAMFRETFRQKRSVSSNGKEVHCATSNSCTPRPFDPSTHLPFIFVPTSATGGYKGARLRQSLYHWTPTWRSSRHEKRTLIFLKDGGRRAWRSVQRFSEPVVDAH